jgi:ABC-2 type transport system ATP-binding protein
MTVLGVLPTAALYRIGDPGALFLGIFTGLVCFVPPVGPVVSAVPPLVLAFAGNPIDALWVLLANVAIQQVEGNLLTPLVMNKAASLLLMASLTLGLARYLREVLEFVELWDDRRKAARGVSGGMQRRLQLAAAIDQEPDLLFVDEPTANLDPILRRKFWEEFEQRREGRRTIFVTTQYVGEAELCDRVGLLVDGTLVAVGTPAELRRQAFGGEIVELSLGGEPGSLAERLGALGDLGRVEGVRRDAGGDEVVSLVRMLVEDADAALPNVMEVLSGADVRSLGVPKPSFDEVFLRLVKETGEVVLGSR